LNIKYWFLIQTYLVLTTQGHVHFMFSGGIVPLKDKRDCDPEMYATRDMTFDKPIN